MAVNYIGIHVFFLVFSMSIIASSAYGEKKKTFYNIAHMANTIKDVDEFLAQGANAIEADVYFEADGTPTYMFHGVPCDCLRICDRYENVAKYLNHVRSITTEGSRKYNRRFALLYLDLKIAKLDQKVKSTAGQQLANLLVNHLFCNGKRRSKINVEIGINNVNDTDFVIGFQKVLKDKRLRRLNKRIGWDVTVNDNLDRITEMWRELKLVCNIWQGDGVTNCLSPLRKVSRLRETLNLAEKCRQSNDKYCIRKVYQWTVDLPAELRKSLRLGVDGIITNKPQRLYNILLEKEFSDQYKLAEVTDNPWD